MYEHVKKDLMLASISGGTDICSCFALGNPMLPVVESELQAFGLGLDACAYDRDDKQVVKGGKAELVCRQPFVAAPVSVMESLRGVAVTWMYTRVCKMKKNKQMYTQVLSPLPPPILP